jgi:hypothetical protein
MTNYLEVAFGAWAQVAVGAMLFAATVAQTFYWLVITPPTVKAVFIVSMEALAFAAYAIVATGLAVIWLDKRTPSV